MFTSETTTTTTLGPSRVEVTPLHLSVTGIYNSGGRQNTHLVHNPDLHVILHSGQRGSVDRIPCNVEDTGLVVVSLGVDGGDHDEVHYVHCGDVDQLEVLGQAIETLTMVWKAAQRVQGVTA